MTQFSRDNPDNPFGNIPYVARESYQVAARNDGHTCEMGFDGKCNICGLLVVEED